MNQILNLTERIGFMGLLDRFQPPGTNTLYVLNYHRVDEDGRRPWLNPDLISTSPDEFEKQMKLIASRYQPVGLQEVTLAASGLGDLPKRAVLVTVDDGYLDFKENIQPIAAQFNIPLVLFISTALVGSGIFWWDELYQIIFRSQVNKIDSPLGQISLTTIEEKRKAYRDYANFMRTRPFIQAKEKLDELFHQLELDGSQQRSTLNWDELRSLAGEGVAIASHSHSHPLLSHISFAQVKSEVMVAQEMIEKEIGKNWPVMAYPDGKPESFNDEVIDAVKECGIRLAFTTKEGAVQLNLDDPLKLPRIGVWRKTSMAVFHYHLTSFYRKKSYG